MSKNRIEIKSKDNEDKEVVVYAVKPTSREFAKAKLESNRAFKEAINSGAPFRKKIFDVMRDQGLWDDEQQVKLDKIEKRLMNNIQKLRKAKGMDVLDGYDVAVEIMKDRIEQNRLLSEQRDYDNFSVEAQVDNASMDCLVSLCVKDDEGNRVFTSVDDYLDKSTEPWAAEAAAAVAKLAFGFTDNFLADLPEHKFLQAFGFMDDEFRLKDKNKESFVDFDGRKVDKDGRYLEDLEGNPIEPVEDVDFGSFMVNGKLVDLNQKTEVVHSD